MIYGYARVSSSGQFLYGTSLESQEKELRANGCEVVFSDAYTGTKIHRPELDKLMGVIKPGDRLVVTKLDRIARSVIQGCELVKGLLDNGIQVQILNMGLMDNTPTGRLIVNVMFAFAEFERDMIVDRTQSGKAVKRATDPNYKEGRKEIEVDLEMFAEYKAEVDAGNVSVTNACLDLGISRAKWYRMCEKYVA